MNTLEKNGLHSTTDYSIFKLREDNREIIPSHVKKLKMLLEQSNDLHINPIMVNTDMEIMDGQHRFLAAKELGIEIYYLIDDNFDPSKIITFNTTQVKWSLSDYLHYWIQHGSEDYLKLKHFIDDMGFSVTCTLPWFIHEYGDKYQSFKLGKFKYEMTEEKLEAILSTKRLIDFAKENKFKPLKIYTQRVFHTACKEFFTSKLVDHDRFFDRLETSGSQIYYCAGWQFYFDQFVEIYNYHMRKDRLSIASDKNKRTLLG